MVGFESVPAWPLSWKSLLGGAGLHVVGGCEMFFFRDFRTAQHSFAKNFRPTRAKLAVASFCAIQMNAQCFAVFPSWRKDLCCMDVATQQPCSFESVLLCSFESTFVEFYSTTLKKIGELSGFCYLYVGFCRLLAKIDCFSPRYHSFFPQNKSSKTKIK